MPYDPPDLAGLNLAQIAELAAQRKLPPVAGWHPEKAGDSEMRIAADGRWYHQGGEITRPAMVRAFSSLLRCEADGSHWLVTPQEKLRIEIEDAPFLAVELASEGNGESRSLAFRLNSDDLVVAGPDHPIQLRGDLALPYVLARDGLWARIARNPYYEMAELALAEGNEPPGLWSQGSFFRLRRPNELDRTHRSRAPPGKRRAFRG
ncbi:MAG: DUF1285 domain-containing protein [Sphingomonadales bacterium]|nr:DUF1285 domain-containing protein [Sphingomonadales bacterium]